MDIPGGKGGVTGLGGIKMCHVSRNVAALLISRTYFLLIFLSKKQL
jgi:hypothetical protein